MPIHTMSTLNFSFENFAAFFNAVLALDLALFAACLLLAWLLTHLLGKAWPPRQQPQVLLGKRGFDGVLFPLILLALTYGARFFLQKSALDVGLFELLVPVCLSLAAIRLGVKILQAAFADAPLVRLVERTFSWVAWFAVVLWLVGVLPLVMDELESIRWKMGGSQISLRTLIEGSLTAGAVLLLTLWVSSVIEARLLRQATGGELSLRKAISNAIRAILMFVGVLLALSAVGFDLTALSVLGGAIGVGIGLGLQKLAANYVSGFVILTERSMRIGDNVRIGGFEGAITQINARYTVVRSLTGQESIVPNEMLVTERVENLSLADPRVWQSTTVSVAYDSDVDQVMALLKAACADQPRVLAEPAPTVALSAFGADGLEFTVGYWLADPENGQLNLRSQVNVAILKTLKSHDIQIPYPQRVVHWQKP